LQVPGRNYSQQPKGRAHKPGRQRDHVGYRACLRLEFAYTCAYCLSLEVEVAAGARHGLFNVDHFRPVARFGSLRTIYANLMWACRACNLAKSAKWPTAAEQARGEEFLDPTVEPLGRHLAIVGDSVQAMSRAGDYMIDELNLNSLEHRTRRQERNKAFVLWQALQSTIAVGIPDPYQKAALEAESQRYLELVLGTCEPWDPELACVCKP
jgi:hypothetical protein